MDDEIILQVIRTLLAEKKGGEFSMPIGDKLLIITVEKND